MGPGPRPGATTAPFDVLQLALHHLRCNRVIGAVVRHRVPDHLAEGGLTGAELARRSGLHPLSVERSLRLLAGFGVFTEAEPRVFANNDVSELLRERPGSARNWALYITADHVWDTIGAVEHSLLTGESAFVHVHGASFWEFLRAHPDEMAVFNAMFAELRGGQHVAIAAAYEWSGAGTVVDVGGGNGSLLATILAANPAARGVLLDQQVMVAAAAEHLEERGVRGRCQLTVADFFDSAPATGDVWILSQVLHDWDDEQCRAILRNCCEQLRPDDRLLVVEMVTVPGDPHPVIAMTDHNMLTLFGEARQRTTDEYRGLFGNCGLELTRVIPTASVFSLVEARRS